jgi:hypothetical protein
MPRNTPIKMKMQKRTLPDNLGLMNGNSPDENKDETLIQDRPAPSLLKSWGKRMSEGRANVIPVYVGGSWTLQVPRGNKRVLTVPVRSNNNKKS